MCKMLQLAHRPCSLIWLHCCFPHNRFIDVHTVQRVCFCNCSREHEGTDELFPLWLFLWLAEDRHVVIVALCFPLFTVSVFCSLPCLLTGQPAQYERDVDDFLRRTTYGVNRHRQHRDRERDRERGHQTEYRDRGHDHHERGHDPRDRECDRRGREYDHHHHHDYQRRRERR